MKWQKLNDRHYVAMGPGGEWSVEKRVGLWMVFDPREQEAAMIGAIDAWHGMAEAERMAAPQLSE